MVWPARARLERMRPVAPGRHHRRRLAVVLIPLNSRNRQVHHLRNLAGDSGEDLPRLRAPGYQRGYAPKRRLFSRQPLDLGSRVAIRNRRGHELGEYGQTVQGIGGQWRALVAGRHDHRTPDTTADEDGDAGRHADVELPGWRGNGAPDLRVVIDSERLAGPLQRGDDARITGRAGPEPAEIGRDLARPGDHCCHTFPLIPEQPDMRNAEQPSDLAG